MRKLALITGASMGIGAALARVFARHDHDLILHGRDRERLQNVAHSIAAEFGVTVETVTAELSDATAMRQALLPIIENRTIDVLVNNAGFGVKGSFAETDLERELAMIQVNIATFVELTKRVLPPMLDRNSGRILNVASTAAFQPGPYMAIYYASKAFVLSFSEAIAEELKGSGVSVTTLCPGPTDTGSSDRAGAEKTNIFSKKLVMMTAAEVAEMGYRGLMAGESVVVAGSINSIGAFATRFLPRSWVFRIMQGIHTDRKHLK